ncbi:MAG: hypothetical protein R2681_17220 [Pyrinomonadaceae bacterium]
MNELIIKLFAIDVHELNKVFLNFAKTKFVAEQSRLVQERGSWINPFVVTSNGETQFNFTDPRVQNAIQAELEEIWARYHGVVERCTSPANQVFEIWEWVTQQKLIQHKFQDNIRTRLEDYNRQNAEAARYLAAGAILGSVAKIAADTALILTGLGIGTSTLAGSGFTIFKSAGTLKSMSTLSTFFGAFGVGVSKSFGCTLAENWSAAKSADLWFTIRTDGIKNSVMELPGFAKSVYDEQMKKIEARSDARAETLTSSSAKPPPPVRPPVNYNLSSKAPPNGVAMKAPWSNPSWATPNGKAPRVPNPTIRAPKPTSAAPNGGSPSVSVGTALKGAAYLMAVWSAGESIKEFKKHAWDLKL